MTSLNNRREAADRFRSIAHLLTDRDAAIVRQCARELEQEGAVAFVLQ
ncbi:hypothetical protein [Croceibacterium ferulae]|nr:hypothetical protein [Croceibacterium ferulae]